MTLDNILKLGHPKLYEISAPVSREELPGLEKTIDELHGLVIQFREKYGISVIAVMREGVVRRTDLRDFPLQFGDALLLFGQRQKLKLLATDPDFLILEEDLQEPLRTHKAWTSGVHETRYSARFVRLSADGFK